MCLNKKCLNEKLAICVSFCLLWEPGFKQMGYRRLWQLLCISLQMIAIVRRIVADYLSRLLKNVPKQSMPKQSVPKQSVPKTCAYTKCA